MESSHRDIVGVSLSCDLVKVNLVLACVGESNDTLVAVVDISHGEHGAINDLQVLECDVESPTSTPIG